ncbi:Acyl-CoA-binding domain-containing protein 5A,Acyl-CoA-binding domain-containing protein 5 [Mytilus coruscus]|uniref:Acyl-CoA-binding domain-containing protein 5A,Acyl-CoA-binding domain-containing protein 5 n=1 Tax=Mytilus coruscus TaxID=42192 RepID=A0A6J8DYG3_MYTCO|nr:Acyl-CoA-binding domain-containing protein 5A,Acyl-CoA-binding domain-containing protein 5 [Mytilus coruscus]
MATTPKERFDAAVKVIHGLPKEGPFQPSYEIMLTFYGLYKQATEGTCTKPKPWSWDIVAKKKWDAWNKLGTLSSEQAMDLYVEELKKIVEAMPQEKPVRDFMETIGTFYELIDERSPFEDEKRSYDLANGDTNSNVIQADIRNGNENSMNHSMLVDPLLKNLVKQDIKMNGMPRGFQDKEFDDEKPTESALSILDSERENWDRISSIKNAQDQNTNGEHPVNGETVTDDKVPSSDRLTSESESEEEFCDTSDQPSPEELSRKASEDQQMSTPLRGNLQNNRQKYVHFSANPSLRTDIEVDQQTLSPIPNRLHRDNLSMSRNFPFGLNFQQRSLHDSLIVHGPSEDSFNVTGLSEIGSENSNSSAQSNSLTKSEVLMEEHLSSENIRTCGGGQISPPGGSSSGKLPSQGSYSSQGYRPVEGYGFYDGFPVEGGQGGEGGGGRDPPYPPQMYGSVNEQIAITLMRLQQDMHTVLQRLDSLEAVSRQQRKSDQKNSIFMSSWWPFPNLTGKTFLFVVIWPMFVYWLMSRRRRRTN